jgi:hypothetical protein
LDLLRFNGSLERLAHVFENLLHHTLRAEIFDGFLSTT